MLKEKNECSLSLAYKRLRARIAIVVDAIVAAWNVTNAKTIDREIASNQSEIGEMQKLLSGLPKEHIDRISFEARMEDAKENIKRLKEARAKYSKVK